MRLSTIYLKDISSEMDFEIILQECFLSDPLPKLLKWYRSAKQNGIRSKKKKKENL